jgi:hypothetical protein
MLVPLALPFALSEQSIINEGTLFPLSVIILCFGTLLMGYKFLRDNFERIERNRAEDKIAAFAAVQDVKSRLDAIERNQRARWTVDHQRIFELELARANTGLIIPNCSRIAAGLPAGDDEA